MGSNLLESGDTFSQLAHDTSSLAAFNTVPGNSYMMVTPLLARDDQAAKKGVALPVSEHVCRVSVPKTHFVVFPEGHKIHIPCHEMNVSSTSLSSLLMLPALL